MRKMTRRELKGYAGSIATDITNYSFDQTAEFIKTHDIEKSHTRRAHVGLMAA